MKTILDRLGLSTVCALSLALFVVTACSDVTLGTVPKGLDGGNDAAVDTGLCSGNCSTGNHFDSTVCACVRDGSDAAVTSDVVEVVEAPPECQVASDCRLLRDSCNGCQTCKGLGKAQPEPPVCGSACVGSCADYVVSCANGHCLGLIPGAP
jgi:hypothetical protein